ncbi:MAG: filamentous hemagglutinin N-terminal domain-containing protein, partial [Magnetococcales bacterium]|nr:filamentous hemagglutinin N-terminal domain-containing protein [Magnetococcales bacterium]
MLVHVLGLSGWLLLAPKEGLALPEQGAVTAGSATVEISTPQRMDINQASDRAIIDWSAFNIAQGEQVYFNLPSNSSMTFNRVIGDDLSRIYGNLTSNGILVLANPHGIIFDRGSIVDVGSLVATSHNVANHDFMHGNLWFTSNAAGASASVVNLGTIRVADGGAVVLAAPVVENQGVIHARLGKVALASGDAFTVDFHGDRLLNFALPVRDGANTRAEVHNSGSIYADGGRVMMTASTAEQVIHGVVDNGGIIEARAVDFRNGEIVLHAGTGVAENSGTLDVSGKNIGDVGGKIEVTGRQVRLGQGAKLDASGESGGGTILIGGDYQGKNLAVQNASQTLVEPNVMMNASANLVGNGGKVIVWADEFTSFQGNILAKGGDAGGNGGLVETSGKKTLSVMGGKVDASAKFGVAGEWLLDPDNIEIVNANSGGTWTGDSFTGTPGSGGATVDVASINAALNAGSSVIVSTGDGDITLTSAISKTSGAAATLTMNATGDIYLNNSTTSTVGALDVTLNANLGAGSVTLNRTGTVIDANGGNVLLNGSTTLQQDSVITAGTVTFGGAVDGAHNLTVNTSGLTRFSGIVGGATALTGLTTNAGGTTQLDANVSTSNGAIAFGDPVILGGDVVLSAGSGAVTFGGAVDGAHNLTVNTSGLTRFSGI